MTPTAPLPFAASAAMHVEGVTGTCKDADRVFPVANISGYVKNGVNSYDDLLTAIATVGPVSVTVAAEPWEFYSSGIFSPPASLAATWTLDHGVQVRSTI